jgi:hypothetical protein
MNYLESSIEVMAPSDLFQWLHASRKSGACRFSRGASIRRVYFQDGSIVACSSNEPHLLLGQFLIANGRIDATALSECMKLQEATGRTLGSLLVESGKLSSEELMRAVAAKAEETIYGLFEWPGGIFRFECDVGPPEDTMSLELDVRVILLEGARRIDENQRNRRVFPTLDVVLHQTERTPDPQSLASTMGRRLYESIDGRRTLAEIILSCRTSEFHACSFLSRLVERGIVRVGEVREPEDEATSTGAAVGVLQALVTQNAYEEAIDLIERSEFERHNHDLLSMLIAKAEAAYLAWAYRSHIPPSAIPRRTVDDPAGGDLDLSGEEAFILDLLGEGWDVRSLVWIAPMRKVATIRALKRLLDRGYIEMQVPESSTAKRGRDRFPSAEELDGVVDQAIGVATGAVAKA